MVTVALENGLFVVEAVKEPLAGLLHEHKPKNVWESCRQLHSGAGARGP